MKVNKVIRLYPGHSLAFMCETDADTVWKWHVEEAQPNLDQLERLVQLNEIHDVISSDWGDSAAVFYLSVYRHQFLGYRTIIEAIFHDMYIEAMAHIRAAFANIQKEK